MQPFATLLADKNPASSSPEAQAFCGGALTQLRRLAIDMALFQRLLAPGMRSSFCGSFLFWFSVLVDPARRTQAFADDPPESI